MRETGRSRRSPEGVEGRGQREALRSPGIPGQRSAGRYEDPNEADQNDFFGKLTPGNSQAKKQPARAIFSVPSAPYRGATVRNLPAPVFSLPGRVPWMYKMGIHLFMRVRRIATDFIISRPSAAIV